MFIKGGKVLLIYFFVNKIQSERIVPQSKLKKTLQLKDYLQMY